MDVLGVQKYLLNSGFGFGRSKVQLEEIEIFFEHQNAPGCFVRVLCSSMNSPYSIAFPPTLSDQECADKSLSIHDYTFYYATSKNFEFGSHEIVFNKRSFHFMMIIKPAPWTTFEWVMELLAAL